MKLDLTSTAFQMRVLSSKEGKKEGSSSKPVIKLTYGLSTLNHKLSTAPAALRHAGGNAALRAEAPEERNVYSNPSTNEIKLQGSGMEMMRGTSIMSGARGVMPPRWGWEFISDAAGYKHGAPHGAWAQRLYQARAQARHRQPTKPR
jgi:hypothetical protein